jgi:hypothetical protein
MAVDVLVGATVGIDVAVKISVGDARVGDCVFVGSPVGAAMAVVAAWAGVGLSTGAAEGSVQAVNRKIRMKEVLNVFFMIFHL